MQYAGLAGVAVTADAPEVADEEVVWRWGVEDARCRCLGLGLVPAPVLEVVASEYCSQEDQLLGVDRLLGLIGWMDGSNVRKQFDAAGV